MTGNGHAYGIPGWGNGELQYYTANNATVADGLLTIRAREQNIAGYGYSSARLRTKGLGDWTYGRFEMRAKLPVGQGLWPAFWMLPSDNVYGTWAASGEIDIMESLGHDPDRIHGTLHYGGAAPANVSSGESYRLPLGSAQDFHTYAIEWERGEFRWYIDDIHYATRTGWWSAGGPYPAPFDQDFHLLLNLAVGGTWPGAPDATTEFPQALVVDYVRVYQRPDDIAPPRRVFDDMDHGDPPANGWFTFDSSIGGGGIDANFTDLPPVNGGRASLQTGWGSGGMAGYLGGFGRTRPTDLTSMTEFRFWINPDPGQSYTLAINLQDDDDGDGAIGSGDDEFEYDCVVSALGPCAIAGGGWQLISIALDEFQDDNSVFRGGNGILDAYPVSSGGNGELINTVIAVVTDSGADVSLRTDHWVFYGELPDGDGDERPDIADNCIEVANPMQTDTDGDAIGNACDPDITGATGANDCVVNFSDLGALRAGFFRSSGQPGFDPDADLSGPAGVPDGVINFFDLERMKSYFFRTPGPSGLPNGCSP